MNEFFQSLTRCGYPPLETPNGEHDDAIDAARTVLRYALECIEAQGRKPGHAGVFDDTMNGLKDLIADLPPQSESWQAMQANVEMIERTRAELDAVQAADAQDGRAA